MPNGGILGGILGGGLALLCALAILGRDDDLVRPEDRHARLIALAYVLGLAVLGFVVAILGWSIRNTAPTWLGLIGGLGIGVGGLGILASWARYAGDVAATRRPHDRSPRSVLIIRIAFVEGLAIWAVVALMLGIFLSAPTPP